MLSLITEMVMLWTGTTRQRKTGNIPNGYVGATREAGKASCEGCARLEDRTCYHWFGSSQMGHGAMMRANEKKPEKYTLDYALNDSVRSAKYVRGAVGGDPNVFTREQVDGWVEQIKAAGMRGLILYTHFFRGKGAHLKGLAMASVDSFAEADEAVNAGWRAAVALPVRHPDCKTARAQKVPVWQGEEFTTPEGKPILICLEQTGKADDCNSCGLCDAQMKTNAMIIGFLEH